MTIIGTYGMCNIGVGFNLEMFLWYLMYLERSSYSHSQIDNIDL